MFNTQFGKMSLFRFYLLCCFCVILCSCKRNDNKEINRIITEWFGKQIFYPEGVKSASCYDGDTIYGCSVNKKRYSVLVYVDSIGCLSCKLQLLKWKEIINEFNNASLNSVDYLFYFNPKSRKQLINLLKEKQFGYPVFVDDKNELKKMNQLSDDFKYQTFLLDKENKVVAIGNPIHNPKVKELYLNIVSEKSLLGEMDRKETMVGIDKLYIDLGKFDWQHEMQSEFVLINTGNNPLVVFDVSTSCGCTSVEYNKEPVKPGDELKLIVKYKADEPGHFSKSIKVFCNTKDSPISLKITGEALPN